MKKHFGLYNLSHNDTLCIIEMDDDLLAQDGYILDHATMTLKPIKNGGMWTLMPVVSSSLEDVLKVINESYDKIVKEPTPSITGLMNRMDALVDAVGLLFGEVKYYLVEEPQDLLYILNPPSVPEGHELKTVTVRVIDQVKGTA